MKNTTTQQSITLLTEDQAESQMASVVSEVGDKAGKVILVLGIIKLAGDFIVIILKFLQL